MKAFLRLGLLGAFIALAATVGIATSGRFAAPADAQIPAGVTVNKACNATVVPINSNSQCIITIAIAGANTAEPITIEARPSTGTGNTATGAVQFLDGASGATGADVDTVFVVNPANAATQALVIGCFGADCSGTIVTTEAYRCVVGGPVHEFIQFGVAAQFVQIQPSITCGPATATLTITCGPPSEVTEVGTVTCTANVNDNDIFPTTASSGTIQLSLPADSGLTFADTGTASLTVRCPIAGFNQPQGCDSVTFTVRGGQGNGELITLNGTYTPDLATVDTTATGSTQIRVLRQPVSKSWTKRCTPQPDGVPNPARQVRVGNTVSCTVTITGQAGETGQATVTLTNAVFQGTAGNQQTFTCANTNPPNGTSCSFSETFIPTDPPCRVMRERVVLRRADGTVVLDFEVPVATFASNTQSPTEIIEVLPKGTGTCQEPVSKTWTKTCEPQPDGVPNPRLQVRVGNQVTCTVTITGDPGEAGRATVTLANATFAVGGGNVQTFDCVNLGPGQSSNQCRFTEVFFPTDPPCRVMRERVVLQRTFDNVVVLEFEVPVARFASSSLAPTEIIEVLPKGTGTCDVASGVSSVKKQCTVQPDNIPTTLPIGGKLFVRAGDQVTCTITVTATSNVTSISGTVTVDLLGQGTLVTPNPLTCTSVSGTNTCTATEIFFPNQSAACKDFVQKVTVRVTGQDFVFENVPAGAQVGPVFQPLFVLPKLDTSLQCPGDIIGPRQPKIMAFACTTNSALAGIVGDPVISPIPGQVRDTFVAGIGILPQALACKAIPVPIDRTPAECLRPFVTAGTVVPVTDDGLLIPSTPGNTGLIGPLGTGFLTTAFAEAGVPVSACGVPAGKIEVSSINGALIDLSGRLTTNLRIECGDISGVFVPITGIEVPFFPRINENTCFGVTFGVAGIGVGFVEINARYEPTTYAVQKGIHEIEGKTQVAFIAPAVNVSLLLSPNPVTVGATGTATARFNRVFVACDQFVPSQGLLGGFRVGFDFCLDPTTGQQLTFNFGSILNGSVVFNIDNTAVASWVAPGLAPSYDPRAGTAGGAQPTTVLPAPSSTAGFITTANQTVVRCGFFPTTTLPFTTFATATQGALFPGQTPLSTFFGGCEQVSANYRGNLPGQANVSATFIPDLPGAFGAGFPSFAGSGNLTAFTGLPNTITPLLGLFQNAFNPTSVQVLNVIGEAPSGRISLVRGCNNVTPTVSESVSAYMGRVSPTSVVISVWEHQAATNAFRGAPGPASPASAAAVADLSSVTRLTPVFVCVNAPGTLDQPAV